MVAAEDAAPLPHRRVELKQDCALMVRALGATDQERCALLLMHDLDGISVPEIASASALGLALDTVYSRLRLARSLDLSFAVKTTAKPAFLRRIFRECHPCEHVRNDHGQLGFEDALLRREAQRGRLPRRGPQDHRRARR